MTDPQPPSQHPTPHPRSVFKITAEILQNFVALRVLPTNWNCTQQISSNTFIFAVMFPFVIEQIKGNARILVNMFNVLSD